MRNCEPSFVLDCRSSVAFIALKTCATYKAFSLAMKLIGTRMSLGQVLLAVLVTSVLGRKVLKTNETGRVFTGLTCYGDLLENGKMCSSVTNMLRCPNTYAEVDTGPWKTQELQL